MESETITISKAEYTILKHKAEINVEVVEDFKKSLADFKKGKFKVRA